MGCKDPSLTYLNNFGYNVVRLPRAGIEPMDVLGKDKSLEKIGRLSELITSTVPIPPVTGPTAVASLNGKKTDNLDAKIGLKLLGDILGGMASAVGLPTLKVSFDQARSVQFEFKNVVSFAVDQAAIGAYVAPAVLADNPVNDHYLSNEDTTEYVIFEVLKSNAISVIPKSKKNVGVAVDVPALQAAVGANVEVKVGAASEAEITFTGADLLTFGFKCFRVEFVNGRWRVLGAKASGDLAFALSAAPDDPILIEPGSRLRLS